VSEVLDDVIAAAQLVPLSQAVEVNPKIDRTVFHDDLDVSFVPMAAVEALSGSIDVSTVRKYAEVKKGYTHFRDGDILFAKVTPCMENGKMAIARKLINGVGFGSTEFHVLRPRAGVDARYIYYFVSSQTFRKEASGHMTGAVGLRRVPSAYLEEQLIPLPGIEQQREIVAELEKQFSRLDDAVANLRRVKANLKRYERATIASLTNPKSFDACVCGTIADIAISLDNMRKPVNKLERAKRPGNIPYLGANGRTGWIDVPLFDEELVLVVEDETFVGRTDPFCYYFADPCWVNNHTHVLRARPEVVSAKYLNLALSYYPFIPLTTGSTGRRKLTKAALMTAPISVPSLRKQTEVIDEVERCLSIAREVEAEVDTNLKRAQALRQATLAKAFSYPEHG
jgi:restriction endonuclease S subunit